MSKEVILRERTDKRELVIEMLVFQEENEEKRSEIHPLTHKDSAYTHLSPISSKE